MVARRRIGTMRVFFIEMRVREISGTGVDRLYNSRRKNQLFFMFYRRNTEDRVSMKTGRIEREKKKLTIRI